MKYLILLLLLSACATYKESKYKSAAVTAAVNTFETLFHLRVDVDIYIVDVLSWNQSPKTVGVCYMFPKHVELLKSYITNHPEDIEQLVMHELGHCVMDLNHDSSRFNIMQPALNETRVYRTYRRMLLQDLYFRCKYISGVCE